MKRSRSRRSLLPFVGQLSRGLFGTATMDDVNVLADHMNKLNSITRNLAKSLVHQENQFSSVIATVNSRMDNFMSGIEDNMLAIKYIHRQRHTTVTNLEETFDFFMSTLINRLRTGSKLNHQLDELKLGASDLANGKLSTLLIPKHVITSTMHDIQQILQTKFHGLHLNIKSINYVYSDFPFVIARNGSRIFITLKLPVSFYKEPLNLFQVVTVPVPLNSSSPHATQFTWDQAIFVILAVTSLSLLFLGLKYYKLTSTCSLCLELTDDKHSILLDLVLLPQCTDYCHIKVPEEITDLRVAESYFNSKLHSSWSGFGIRNTLTGATIEIDSVISIYFWQARSIKQIFRKQFFVYIYKRQHGLMIPLQ